MDTNISQFPISYAKSSKDEAIKYGHPSQESVVNLGMYKLKKSLQREGFEIVEDKKGRITLVVRVAK